MWEAGGEDKACIVFCLLMCRRFVLYCESNLLIRYFKQKATTELSDADLYHLRKIASEHMAKLIIDSVELEGDILSPFLAQLLLQRYSILQNGERSRPMSAVELAIDVHAIRVIATNNYQKCIKAIWKGYYTIQYDEDGRLSFQQYPYLLSRRIMAHLDTERLKGT